MAVLVITGGSDLDVPVVSRLLNEGDEVRVLEATTARRDEWRAMGAFFAGGEADDPDLVERAAQNARTIVVLAGRVTDEVIAIVLEAGLNAGVDRLVCCAEAIAGSVKEAVRASRISHVLIETGRPRLLRRKEASSERAAEAVDAADDLAGDPRIEVDLTDPKQAERLLL